MGWCEENGKWPICCGHKNYGFFAHEPHETWAGSREHYIPLRLWQEARADKHDTAWEVIRAVDAAAIKLGMSGTRFGLCDIPSAQRFGYFSCSKPVPVDSLRPRVILAGAGL